MSGLGGVSARDGWAFGAAFGKRINDRRRELDFTQRDNSVDAGATTGGLRTSSLMANVLFDVDFLQINEARSYVGAGIGAAYSELEVDNVGLVSDTTWAYQFIAGMEKPLRNGANAFVEYRYFGTADTNFGGTEIDLHNQSLFFGLQFHR